MHIEIKIIDIPKRVDAEATQISVTLFSEDLESLKTKPYAFMLPGGPGANHSHPIVNFSLEQKHLL